MFRRESARERTLLRLIESLQRQLLDAQRQNADLMNRVMYMAEKPWHIPEQTYEPEPEQEEEIFEYPEALALDEVS